MKNKGFTLIELLGVIVLLGVLGVVIIPSIGDSITNSKNNAYLAQVESIKKGVNDFLVDNTDILSEDGTYEIKLGAIKQGGYLPIDIKNPITRKNFSNESLITVNVVGDKYETTLDLNDLVEVTENVNSNSPIIILNGNYIEYVEVNSEYVDKGASAKSSDGDSLTIDTPQIILGDETKSYVDTSRLNTYNIVYSATDSEGRITTATRTVIVRDTTAPTIKIPEDITLDLIQLSRFDTLKGVVVSDNYDGNVDVTISSNLANIPGNYVVTYTSTDSSGNTSSVRRVFNVVDNRYELLEYVKTDGNQYIEFDYKAKTDTKVELDIQLIENENTMLSSTIGYSSIIGESSWEDYTFICNFGGNSYQRKQIYYWVDLRFEKGGTVKVQGYSQVTNRSVMTVKSGSVSFQGIETEAATKTADNLSNLLLLGSFNNTENKIVSFNRYDAKVYGFKIYESDEIIMDLVPCNTASGVTGLFDLVNGKFYPSDGEEDFLSI